MYGAPHQPLVTMRKLARWHIWLGWLVGVPLLLWLASGLFMSARPIDEVRGTTLRIKAEPLPIRVKLNGDAEDTLIREGRMFNQRGRSILLATFMDGSVRRIDLGKDGSELLPPVDAAEARLAVALGVEGGKQVAAVKLFDAAHPPLDFRKAMAAWQVTLADGTHVYVGRDSGEIEAIRTPWWRFYDFMWGLHIMDLQTREDSSNPFLWLFGSLALGTSAMGAVLLFRRRRRAR